MLGPTRFAHILASSSWASSTCSGNMPDVAGNTGLGVILAYEHKRHQDPHVVCFDLPAKEAEGFGTCANAV